MRSNSRSKRLLGYLQLVLCLVSYSTVGKQRVASSESWAGQYKWVGGNHVMTIEQFDSDLSVDLRNLDAKTYPPPGNLMGSFVARISGRVAKFRELRDPKNCRIDLRRVPDGIMLEDHCGGPNGGLYLKKK
ncbi:MAG: hypothetical protein HY537_11260 [Deltaproteobacteria bacterium]|nr:hypothetical protein [Deltaproteobacteria bacterium]